MPSTAAIRNGQSSRGNSADGASVVVLISYLGDAMPEPNDGRGLSCDYEPKPSFFFRSSHLVRAEASGRLASEVQSTIEP